MSQKRMDKFIETLHYEGLRQRKSCLNVVK